MGILPREFYLQKTCQVAQSLLGKLLVRKCGNRRVSGVIVETEAYRGFDDTASHAHKGPTKRCRVMYGEAGHAYVYLTYGIHYMFNFVTEEKWFPAAVLIRAVEPVEGVESMFNNRNVKRVEDLTSGPGKAGKAFGITKALNGVDLTEGKKVWVEELGSRFSAEWQNDFAIEKTPRVGIDYADKQARNRKWRFLVQSNRFVSRRPIVTKRGVCEELGGNWCAGLL